MITVERKEVSRKGIANLGWMCGSGYVHKEVTIKTQKWCILEEGKIIAECRGKKQAEKIKNAFDKII